jgi:CheY-like chemotaxis protein
LQLPCKYIKMKLKPIRVWLYPLYSRLERELTARAMSIGEPAVTDRATHIAAAPRWRDPHCLDILLIEDSPADANLVRTLLLDIQPQCDLHVVQDGVEALDFLYRRGKYTRAPLPNIIVLDWILPRQSGDKVLSAIKSDPELHPIPIIVLSSSAAGEEVLRGYDLLASCWVVKGSDLADSRRRVRAIVEFWAGTAQLPKTSRNR